MAATLMAPWRRIVCLYHYPCPDGITAALAAWLHHRRAGRPAEFLPNTTYTPLTVAQLGLQGDELVYLLDFAGPPGFAREVAARAGRCVVLDHHKTAAEDLTGAAAAPPNLEVHFDMQRSGATIAAGYFLDAGELLPARTRALFQYIEDSDLWRWRLPDSRAFYAGFLSLGLDLSVATNPGVFEQLLALEPGAVIAAGQLELRRQAVVIEGAVGRAHVVGLGGAGTGRGWGRALAVHVSAEEAELLRSALGNALAEESARRGLRAMAAVAYPVGQGDGHLSGAVKVSLRSKGEGEDTTVVSKAYGGGGHLNASSFVMPKHEFDSWRVS